VRLLDRFSLLPLLILLALSASASADDAAAPQPEPPPAADQPAVDSAPPIARRVVLRGLKFGSGTAYIEPDSAGTLELVAQRMKENPDTRVRITGHTDAVASPEYNLELSKERAESVKRILVGYGIASERIDVVGMGEEHPIAPNDTREGRALNRRVELDVLQ
jgi:outer membrane protein OmpA-like peptidoglycan-associated protein